MDAISWLAFGLVVLGFLFLVYRAGRVWMDMGQRGFSSARRFGWTLLGAIAPDQYWWRARIESLLPQEQADLLSRETARLGLSRADSLRCSLCTAEIERAWTLTSEGRPTVGPSPVACPRCDFRLDSCRHCVHFLLGRLQVDSRLGFGCGDVTLGRFSRYKVSQLVERACPPEVARQLRRQGYQQIQAPLPVVDSFIPPDFCTGFAPDPRRLKISEVRWPDARRAALLRLLALSSSLSSGLASTEESSSGDERWLL